MLWHFFVSRLSRPGGETDMHFRTYVSLPRAFRHNQQQSKTFWGKSDASCSVSLTPIKGSNRDTTHEHHYLLHGVWMFPLHYKWLTTQEVPQLHPPTHWDGNQAARLLEETHSPLLQVVTWKSMFGSGCIFCMVTQSVCSYTPNLSTGFPCDWAGD